jgi:hypothetical protein
MQKVKELEIIENKNLPANESELTRIFDNLEGKFIESE